MRSFVEWLYDSVPHSLLLSYSRHSFMGLKRGPDIMRVQSVLFLIGDCKATIQYLFFGRHSPYQCMHSQAFINHQQWKTVATLVVPILTKVWKFQGWFQGTQMASGCLLKLICAVGIFDCSFGWWLLLFALVFLAGLKKKQYKKTDPSLNRSIGAQWAQGSTKRCA